MRELAALSHVVVALMTTSPAQQNHTYRVPVSNRALTWLVSQKVFGSHASTAFCIAGAETGHTYDPWAVSRTDDHGEWQIHRGLEKYGKKIYNIWFNATVAYRMSHGGTNWSQWTTHSSCGV